MSAHASSFNFATLTAFYILCLASAIAVFPSAQVGWALWLAPALLWAGLADLSTLEIPGAAVMFVAIGGLLFRFVHHPDTLALQAALALAATAFFWGVGEVFFRRTGKEGLGIGDAKLIGAGALWTGGAGLWAALFIAASGGIAAVLLRRYHAGTDADMPGIPFAPFLGGAIYIVFLMQICGFGLT